MLDQFEEFIQQSEVVPHVRHASEPHCHSCTYEAGKKVKSGNSSAYLRSHSVPPESETSDLVASEIVGAYSLSQCASAMIMSSSDTTPIQTHVSRFDSANVDMHARDDLGKIDELDNEAFENLIRSDSWHSLRGDLSRLMRRTNLNTSTVRTNHILINLYFLKSASS